MAVPRGSHAVVVDSSVAVKWWHEEVDSQAARALRDAHLTRRAQLVAPSVLPYEVANALRYGVSASERDVIIALDDLEAMQIQLAAFEGELRESSIQKSFRLGLAVYDASFFALAEMLDCRLYTADEKALKRAGPGTGAHIREFVPRPSRG